MSRTQALMYWRLDGHEVVPATHSEFVQMMEDDFEETRRVAKTKVGEAKVSTVFLSLDHNWSGQGGPILFETMVFGGEWDEYQFRYRTWDEAQAGHDAVVAALREEREPQP